VSACTAWLIVKASSERVPGKNLRDFAGQPLVRWIVEALLAVDEVERILVNTDAVEPLRAVLGDDPRIVLRRRPDDLRDGRVDANTLLRRDLADPTLGLDGRLLLTHATNPLLRPPTIRAALHAFDAAPEATSLMSVTRRQGRFFGADGPLNHDPALLLPTQDLAPVDEENSCLYLVDADTVRACGHRLGDRPLRWPIPPSEAVDIDEPADWRHAELLARGRAGAGPSAVLFDFDGTLVDSLPEVAEALSATLAPRGPFAPRALHPWLGHGARPLLAGALGTTPDAVDSALLESFLATLASLGGENTTPFPGATLLLDALAARGIPLAICTNKPSRTLRPALEALGWADRFAVILAPDDVPRPKPAPDMLLAALDAMKVAPSGAVYVGDTPGDADAAARAGIAALHVSWGYGVPTPRVPVANSPAAVADLVGPLAAWGRVR